MTHQEKLAFNAGYTARANWVKRDGPPMPANPYQDTRFYFWRDGWKAHFHDTVVMRRKARIDNHTLENEL